VLNPFYSSLDNLASYGVKFFFQDDGVAHPEFLMDRTFLVAEGSLE